MHSHRLQGFVQGMGLLIIIGIQIYANYWQLLFREKVALLSFNPSTLGIAFVEVMLHVVSGVLLAMILFPRMSRNGHLAISRTVLVLSILLPLLMLVIKGFVALGGFRGLSMNLMFLWNWAVLSPVPSLWLGLAIIALMQRPAGSHDA